MGSAAAGSFAFSSAYFQDLRGLTLLSMCVHAYCHSQFASAFVTTFCCFSSTLLLFGAAIHVEGVAEEEKEGKEVKEIFVVGVEDKLQNRQPLTPPFEKEQRDQEPEPNSPYVCGTINTIASGFVGGGCTRP
ncbi:hypothetical protein VNO80_09433 [Phaseolus coccineus]|uniref:Uncharacterized protein n=1 Tax=Phaseolus coccineus TaxID=3886 RepID=A0AAN9N800_PHACN